VGEDKSLGASKPLVEPEPSQIALLDAGEWWENYWVGMPDFVQEDLEPARTIYVHFESRAAVECFFELIGQKVPAKALSIWYPERETRRFSNKAYVDPTMEKSLEPILDASCVDDVLEPSEFDESSSGEEGAL